MLVFFGLERDKIVWKTATMIIIVAVFCFGAFCAGLWRLEYHGKTVAMIFIEAFFAPVS